MAYIGQSLTEGTRRVYTYVATASQTTFNAVYGVGAVDVYQNGILLQPSDYTATNGVTVVLGVGAAANDEITVVCHNTFSVADTVSASQGGTFSNPVTIDGDGATVLTVDRATSDGTIIDVQKDGSTVGRIGTADGFTYYTGGSGSGVKMKNAAVVPTSGSGVDADGTESLGQAAARWSNLYLSGGVYLGGTGSANHLDDYEEGSYTVYLTDNSGNTSSTSYTGYYTKVGNMVTISVYAVNINSSGMTTSASIQFDLPFVGVVGHYYVGSAVCDGFTLSSGRTQINPRTSSGQSYGIFRETGSGVIDAAVTWGEITASSSDVFITLTYRTTA